MTFTERVAEFWSWFPQVAERYRAAIDQGNFDSCAQEMTDRMIEWFPRLAWVFGPGENDGHSLTLSGEGEVLKQMQCEFWLSQAKSVPGWIFFASRQPSPASRLDDLQFEFGEGLSVRPGEVEVQSSVDEENQKLDITVWHPIFESLPEDTRWQIVFLLLDESLGEFGTQTWIGTIDVEPFEADDKTRSVVELAPFIGQVIEYFGWESLDPLESYSVYEVPEQTTAPRGDTLVGRTCTPDLIREFLSSGGEMELASLDESGAEAVYVSLKSELFETQDASDYRAKIEDAIAEALTRSGGGRVLGGAFGIEHSYIDLLLFDGEKSRQTVNRTLQDLQLLPQCDLHPFATLETTEELEDDEDEEE